MELKTYSVLIAWSDTDDEQGEFGIVVRAPDMEEAEAMARAQMRRTGQGTPPFGRLMDVYRGSIWDAHTLESALRPIVWQLQRMDGLPEEVEAMIADAEKALAACEPDHAAWGALHYDGGAAPDFSRFAYLEIDGCVMDEDDPEENTVIGGKPDNEAEFWTIYGREKETGMAQAVQDCITRAEANYVLRLMMERSGLPGYRVGEEMPDEIKGVGFPHNRDDCDGEHSAALLDDPVATWRYEVANRLTTAGFRDWQLAKLTEELEGFQDMNGLPRQCAREQWHALHDRHPCRPWLSDFVNRWEQAEKEA